MGTAVCQRYCKTLLLIIREQYDNHIVKHYYVSIVRGQYANNTVS